MLKDYTTVQQFGPQKRISIQIPKSIYADSSFKLKPGDQIEIEITKNGLIIKLV